jgi:hypothetical protein
MIANSFTLTCQWLSTASQVQDALRRTVQAQRERAVFVLTWETLGHYRSLQWNIFFLIEATSARHALMLVNIVSQYSHTTEASQQSDRIEAM